MTADSEFLSLTGFAVVAFGVVALFFGRFAAHIHRQGRRPLPPAGFLLAFRLWFGALALGALVLLLFSRHGLLAGR